MKGSRERYTTLQMAITCEIQGEPESLEAQRICGVLVTDVITGADTGEALKSFFSNGEKGPIMREGLRELIAVFLSRMAEEFGYEMRAKPKEGH